MKTGTLLIRTPEGVVFSQQLAGPVTRFLALVVDLACISAVMSVVNILLLLIALLSPGLTTALNVVGYFVISIGYAIACEWAWRGQTIGKRLLRIRVVDAEGLRLQFNQIITRNLLRVVDALPLYFLGGIVCWFSNKAQRLGDIAANTIVIRQPRLVEPDIDQLVEPKYNSLRLYPHLAARLRQHVSPEEAATGFQALLRRDEFEAGPRVELFGELAHYFRAKVDFPPEALDGITDEQYIRNLVDVVYRARK